MTSNRSVQILLYVYAAVVFFLLLAPLVIIFIVSFSSAEYLTFPPPSLSLRWYEVIFGRPQWQNAFITSIVSALTATVLALVAGTLASLALVRGKFRFRSTLYMGLLVPAIVPTVVTAAALFGIFAKLRFTGNVFGIGIGQSVLSLPFVVIVLTATLQSFDIRLEQAAISLGASPLRAFMTVTLPVIRPAMISAAVFAFLNAFDEVLIALFLSGPRTTTVPVMIWNSVTYDIQPTVAAVSTVVMAFAFVLLAVVLLVNRFLRHGSAGGGEKPIAPA